MKKSIGGLRAWLVETWHGGEDEPWECLEISRQLFLDKTMAHRAYDRAVISDAIRKAVMSEIDIIPVHVVRKTETV